MKPRIPAAETSAPGLALPTAFGSAEEAIAYFEDVLFREPRNQRAHSELAKLYRTAGRSSEASLHENAATSIRENPLVLPAPAKRKIERALRQRKRDARANGLAIALAAHALLILILALWMLGEPALPDEAPLQIAGTSAAESPDPGARFVAALQQRRPPVLHPTTPRTITSHQPQPIHLQPDNSAKFDDPNVPDDFGAPFSQAGEASSRGDGNRRAGGTVEFFGQRSHAERVVFVVDFSASMNQDRRLIRLKSELYRSLAKLPDGMPFNIIYYADSPWLGGDWSTEADERAIPERVAWRVASEAERRLTNVEIANMKAEGSTYWAPPLRLALAMNPKPDLIWLLSDGDAVDHRGLTKKIRRLLDGQVRINTIGIELGGEPFQSLIDIAQQTGGSYSIIMRGAQHSGSEAHRYTDPAYGKAQN